MELLLNEPQSTPDACVIWLHGLGADGSDFAGIVDQLGLPLDHKVRFIFPSAPFMPITVNDGMVMRAWYDIRHFDRLGDEDAQGIENSRQLIERLVTQQLQQGVASERILLAGFSQGGAVSLYTGLRCATRLGGMIALSSYLPLANDFIVAQYPVNRETAIFMAHGMLDPVVPYALGAQTFELLTKAGCSVTCHTYPMVHTVVPEEIVAIGAFICDRLGYTQHVA